MLLSVLKGIDDGDAGIRRRYRRSIYWLFGLAVAFGILSGLQPRFIAHILPAEFSFLPHLVGGAVIGMLAYHVAGLRASMVLISHLDRESVLRRLASLDPHRDSKSSG